MNGLWCSRWWQRPPWSHTASPSVPARTTRPKTPSTALEGKGEQNTDRSRQGSCQGAPCRALTCLSWPIDGFIHLDEGASASPTNQDLLLLLCTEIVAIGDLQLDSAHLLAACRFGDLGQGREVARLAGSRRRQDGIRAYALLVAHPEL